MIKTGMGHVIQHYEIKRTDTSGDFGRRLTEVRLDVEVKPDAADALIARLEVAMEDMEP